MARMTEVEYHGSYLTYGIAHAPHSQERLRGTEGKHDSPNTTFGSELDYRTLMLQFGWLIDARRNATALTYLIGTIWTRSLWKKSLINWTITSPGVIIEGPRLEEPK